MPARYLIPPDTLFTTSIQRPFMTAPAPAPDAVLLRQIAQEDLAAHRELCARYRLFVYAEAYAILLLRQIAQEDLAAHRELCARYRLFVYAEAYAILWDAALAELAAAEAFQEVWRSAGHFDPGAGTAVAWLSRITRSLALRRRASVCGMPIQSPEPSESGRGERGAGPL